jgi:hypothetical protein
MSATTRKYITPVYDTLLDKALGNVIISFFAGNSSQAWDSLLTLNDILPEDIQDKCKGLIDEVETHITIELRKRGYAQSDSLFRRMYLENYVGKYKHELFNKIVRLLSSAGYLKAGSEVPIGQELT